MTFLKKNILTILSIFYLTNNSKADSPQSLEQPLKTQEFNFNDKKIDNLDINNFSDFNKIQNQQLDQFNGQIKNSQITSSNLDKPNYEKKIPDPANQEKFINNPTVQVISKPKEPEKNFNPLENINKPHDDIDPWKVNSKPVNNFSSQKEPFYLLKDKFKQSYESLDKLLNDNSIYRKFDDIIISKYQESIDKGVNYIGYIITSTKAEGYEKIIRSKFDQISDYFLDQVKIFFAQ